MIQRRELSFPVKGHACAEYGRLDVEVAYEPGGNAKEEHEDSVFKLNPLAALIIYYSLESKMTTNVFKLDIRVWIHMMIC